MADIFQCGQFNEIMKKLFIPLLLAGAIAAGWVLRGYFGESGQTTDSGRRVLYYQSAMHPWVKSDKPGRCTICGMELTPVYEGEKGLDESAGDVVALTQTQIQVLQVQTSEAKKQPLTRTLQVAGMIDDNASRHRVLSAWVDGRVDKLHVNFMGAEVGEGEPLAEIYSPRLLQAEAEYRQLTGELRKNAALRLRQMGLSDGQIAALDKKPSDVLTSQILAPIGGTVVAKNISEGEFVTAGAKLFEIADFSTMWFQFRAYEQDLPWIEPKQCVTITTPSLPGKTFEGMVTFIDPNFDEATRSTKVRVELPNPVVNGRRALLHRLYADGAVNVEAPEVLTVPRSAVMETGREAVVYVDQGGGAYARTVVTTGRRGDSLVEVLSGLKEGDKVVTQGNLLMDGQAEMNRAFMRPVEPQALPPAAAPDALTEPQQKAITDFVQLADAMAAALAADDLAGFNKASEPAMEKTGVLVEALGERRETADLLPALEKAMHFHGFDDIKSARIAFHKFTAAATPVMELLRTAKGAPDFQVWECAMVDEAIPDAPKKGRWLQAGGRPGHNPFFGKEMLECAQEIKRIGRAP
jgi:Cu(I)/Ag(I) efflux system membrane fusion protein